MPYLSHKHRAAALVAKVDIRLNCRSCGVASIAMAGEHQLRVIFRVFQRLEIAVPLWGADKDHMVLVNLTNRRHSPFVEGLELGIEFILIIEICGNRLVYQFIAENHRLVLIIIRNRLPYVAELFLRLLAFKKPRIAIRIVDIVSGLTAGGIMHVKNEIKVVGATPAHHAVYPCKTILAGCKPHVVFICEEFVMKRQADCVGAGRRDIVNVCLGYIVVFKLLPEFCGFVRSDKMTEKVIDLAWRVHALEAEHVTFRIKPVAKICSDNEKLASIGLYQIMAFNLHELNLLLRGISLTRATPRNRCKQHCGHTGYYRVFYYVHDFKLLNKV